MDICHWLHRSFTAPVNINPQGGPQVYPRISEIITLSESPVCHEISLSESPLKIVLFVQFLMSKLS